MTMPDGCFYYFYRYFYRWMDNRALDTIRGKRSIGTRGIFSEVKLSGILILWDVRRNYKSGYNG